MLKPSKPIAPEAVLPEPPLMYAPGRGHFNFGNPYMPNPENNPSLAALVQKAAINAAAQDSYKIKKGDTISGLAKRFGINPWQALADVNGVQGPKYMIREGATLNIPRPGDTTNNTPPEPDPVPPPPPPPPPPPAPPPPNPPSEVLYQSEYDAMIKEGKLPPATVVIPDPPPPPPPSPGPTYKEEPAPEGPKGDPTKLPGMFGTINSYLDPAHVLSGHAGDTNWKPGIKDYISTALFGLGAGAKPIPGPTTLANLPKGMKPGYELPNPAAFDSEAAPSYQAQRLPDATGRVEPWFRGSQVPGVKGYIPELGGLPSRFGSPVDTKPQLGYGGAKVPKMIDGRIEPTFPRIRKPQSQAQKDINAMWRRHDKAAKNKINTPDPEVVKKVLEMMRMKGGFNG